MLTPSELYSPADQAILAAYVGGQSGALGYEEAINENGLPDVCEDDPALAAAAVVLSGIQRRLPQWGGFDGSQVHLSRKLNRSSDGALQLAPTLVCMVNWATSGPNCSWPIAYHLTYLPAFDVEVLTASSDIPELFGGMCDIAIASSPPKPNRRHLAIEMIAACWQDQIATFGSGWEDVVTSGLVDRLTAVEILRVGQNDPCDDIETPSAAAIGDTALTVFARDELQALSKSKLLSLAALIRLRLVSSKRPLSTQEQAELRRSVVGHKHPSSAHLRRSDKASIFAIKGDTK